MTNLRAICNDGSLDCSSGGIHEFYVINRGDLDLDAPFFAWPSPWARPLCWHVAHKAGGVLKREQAGDGVINRRPIVGPPVADNTGNHV